MEETQIKTNYKASQVLLILITQLKEDFWLVSQGLIELSHANNMGIFHIQIKFTYQKDFSTRVPPTFGSLFIFLHGLEQYIV